jgi:hypothetical protein
MNNRLGCLLIAFLVAPVAATPASQTRWSTLAPPGDGFSVEVPGLLVVRRLRWLPVAPGRA